MRVPRVRFERDALIIGTASRYHAGMMSTASTRTRISLLPLLAAAVALVLLGIRQLFFVQQYAVDVLYWDSWDLYQPLYRGQGWWASFEFQQGPHRQGLGGLLMRAMAERSHWDCRWDAASVAILLIIAAVLGLLLALRCGVRGWAMVGVPIIYLNIRQYQMLVVMANPSPQAIPVVLLTLFGLICFVRQTPIRLALVVIVTFFAVFTGYTIFLGLVTMMLLGIEITVAFRAGDRRHLLQLAIAFVATIALQAAFLIGYSWQHTTMSLAYPPVKFLDYLKFIALLLANAVGVTHQTLSVPDWMMFATGSVLALTGIAIWIKSTIRLFRHGMAAEPVQAVIFILLAYGAIFSVNAAIGRTRESWQLAASSRYVTLCIPILMPILLDLATAPRRAIRMAATWFAALLAAGTAQLHGPELASAQWAHDGCLRWRAAYVVTHDFASATALSNFPIYPNDSITGCIRYVEQNKLNLFDPDVFGTTPNQLTRTPKLR